MNCNRCEADAVIFQAYSGAHLCEEHLRRSVEKRVRRRIRRDGLLATDATPSDPDVWIIGLSGGKDSAVLTHILDETLREDPRIELVAVTIHEGIAGYRDESVTACRELTAERDIQHELIRYEDEFDITMDTVANDESASLATCSYCGVFRRDILHRMAEEFDGDLLLTGHNLDDEAQTAMMNFLAGDVDQMAKHFEASLGALADRKPQERFIPRAKPLRDIPEREVALYAHFENIPAHITECPHADEAFRGTIQRILHSLEEDHPGTKHSIMAGYERMASLATNHREGDDASDLTTCETCGSPTMGDRCRRCEFLDQLVPTA